MSWFNRPTAPQVGWGYFRDAFLNADPMQIQQGGLGDFDAYSRWEARQIRYDIFWSMWQGSFYRDQAHFWAPAVKHAFGVYKHTRSIFNPVRRLMEFHVCHLMGGHLDPKAGDGEASRTAVPILTEHESIREPIARLWKTSKFAALKSVWTRQGSCLGDAALIVDDDPDRRQVKFRVIHPGHLKWVDKDSAGNVLSYTLEKMRYDPRGPGVKDLNPTVDPRGTRSMVKYNEEAYVDKGRVIFKTFMNGDLFNWRGVTEDGAELPDTWEVPYPFIPLALVQHVDVGLPWGVAEPHGLSKFLEIDDVASGLNDQIRKRIRAPKLLAGVAAPKGSLFGQRKAERDNPRTDGMPRDSQDWDGDERQQSQFLYGPIGAAVHDLTNDLDTPGVSGQIKAIMEELERDYPELQMDVWSTGDPSGRALRVARQRCENKIQERRTNYDAALVMAHKFAMAIGSIQGYEGYQGLPTDPFEDGELDHEIGHRPVFSPDPLDDIEEGSAFWAMAGAAVKAGMPLDVLLKREGWGDDEVAEVMESKSKAAAEALAAMQAASKTMVHPGAPVSQNGNGKPNPPQPQSDLPENPNLTR